MSKPTGPIPPQFAEQEQLTIGGRTAEQWVEAAGDTPLFVYDVGSIGDRLARLRAALPDIVDIHYAVKANPWEPLLAQVAPLVGGLDVASAGEMVKALAVKPAQHISFAGPGKRDNELEAAIRAGVTLNAESVGEVDRALRIGKRLGLAPQIAIRVNPDFELRGSGMKMGGRASPFGIDVASVPGLVRKLTDAGAQWRGFHIFAGSQSLDTAAIIETQAATVDLAARLAGEAGAVPPLVNLGGGFGIPYFHGDTPVDIAAIGTALAEKLADMPVNLSGSRFAIELGRWIVGEAGVYLTRIVDIKTSGEESFWVVDGGLNHQLAASGNFGTVVRRNYPIAVADRLDHLADVETSVVGPLCTPLDRLGDRVVLPKAEVGDLIAIFCAGAYGASASPSGFLGHPAAREILANAKNS
ncbi:pyridoxal-dependent decarboxylase, exosortase A system-associated [Sphingosinithalassobacter portus]|uniref:pyridoxal-dependent decarboxylase, exosortase A system-associated n=1 Tax=Stakelama portus TaxID=2676234 RepID=UPI000D6E76D7|nr:pyridoxal-dependent decarboxylase, exosortase A system-associated [Sphingosinithalassobacter portus]